MVASSTEMMDSTTHSVSTSTPSAEEAPPPPYQEEMCEKLIQLSFAKIVNSKSERGGARLHKNLLILHLLQKARFEQRNRLLLASTPSDTTSRVDYDSNAETPSEEAISCVTNPGAVVVVGNAEQMQTGQLATEGDEEDETEDRIEIDETSGQQRGDDGTFSTTCCYERLTSSCLSSSAPPESGFDGNYGPGIRAAPPSTESRQQASSRQTDESDTDKVRDFDFSIDVAEAEAETKLRTTSEEGTNYEPDANRDGSRLRHQNNQRRRDRHRRRRSASAKIKPTRNESSSSEDSDESSSSSSSEENYCSRSDEKTNANMENGSEHTKARDCLKRKLDDTCANNNAVNRNCSSTPSSGCCDWYSAPKMACLVHGGGGVVVETTNTFQHQQHQNLNGLISVLQSAALTSADESSSSNGKREDDDDTQLLNHFCDTEGADGSMPMTRSLSCPGLMELACES